MKNYKCRKCRCIVGILKINPHFQKSNVKIRCLNPLCGPRKMDTTQKSVGVGDWGVECRVKKFVTGEGIRSKVKCGTSYKFKNFTGDIADMLCPLCRKPKKKFMSKVIRIANKWT